MGSRLGGSHGSPAKATSTWVRNRVQSKGSRRRHLLVDGYKGLEANVVAQSKHSELAFLDEHQVLKEKKNVISKTYQMRARTDITEDSINTVAVGHAWKGDETQTTRTGASATWFTDMVLPLTWNEPPFSVTLPCASKWWKMALNCFVYFDKTSPPWTTCSVTSPAPCIANLCWFGIMCSSSN